MRILLGTLVLGGSLLAAEHGREALSGMSTFQVRDVEVAGGTYVSEAEIVGLMALRPNSSIWDDRDVWIERVERHPMVRSADIRRRFPAGLRVTVEEREPVALAPTPTLEPVDAEGYRLPVDPSRHRLDLPVLATRAAPARGARLVPREVRELVAELGRMMSADTTFLQRVSELGWADDGSLRVRWTEPPVDFLLPPGAPAVRLREGLAALADAVSARPTDPPEEIDLRFADQVVVRRTRD
jgi:cell division septal protein FtsQ